jgi:hypothetical protein
MTALRRILLSPGFERAGAVFAGAVIVWAIIVLFTGGE